MSTPVRQARHLHLGLLIDGKLARECVLPPQRCAILGTASDATFALPGPRRLLFSATDGRWELHLTSDLAGKLVKDGTPQSLHEARSSPHVLPRGEAVGVALTGGERGSLRIDARHTVLFRFTDPAPVALPTDYRPAVLDADDPVFFGFLGVACAAAAAFLMVVANTHITTSFGKEELTRLTQHVAITMPPVIEEVVVDVEPVEAPAAPATPTVKRPVPKPDPEPEIAQKNSSSDKVERVRRSSRLLSDPTAFADILGKLTTTTDDELEEALKGVRSERTAHVDPEGLRSGTQKWADGVIIVSDTIGGGTLDPTVGTVPEPVITARITVPETVAPEVGDRALISQIVERNFASLSYCYEKELRNQPGLAGRMELEFIVHGGTVEDAAVILDGIGNPSLTECLEQAAFRWNFRTVPEAEFVHPFVFRAR